MPDPISVTRDNFERLGELVDNSNVLLLGAPSIGKSRHIEKLSDGNHITDPNEITEPDTDDIVYLDDFVELYLNSSDAQRSRLLNFLETSTGTCLVTRPRHIEWLLGQPENNIDERFDLDRFEICFFQYEEREYSLEVATDIADDLSEFRVDQRLDELHYEYSFTEDLATVPDYASYIPTLISEISIRDADSALFPEQALEVLDQRGGRIGRWMAATLDDHRHLFPVGATSAIENTVVNIASVGPGFVLGPAAGAAVGILMQAKLQSQEGGDGPELAGLATSSLPHTDEYIEEQLDLPPRTLENLRDLSSRRDSEQVIDRLAELDELQEFAREQKEVVSELQATISTLEERQSRVDDLVSQAIRSAAQELKGSREDVLLAEAESYLDIDRDLAFSEVPYHGDHVSTLIEQLRTGSDVIPLVGPHGTGKTTAVMRAAEELAPEGWGIYRTSDSISDITYLRQNLEARSDDAIAVHASYLTGGHSADDIIQLFELLEAEVVDAVLIECRVELQSELQERLEYNTTADRRLSAYVPNPGWPNAIRFEPLDDTAIREVTNWTIDVLQENTLDNGTIDKIVALADGNPEIAKIATRIAINEGSLQGAGSATELIWTEIKNLVTSETQRGRKQAKLLDLLAIYRGAPRSVLERHIDGNLDTWKESLAAYIRTESGSRESVWYLTPDIYADVIFQYHTLHELSRYIPGLSSSEEGPPDIEEVLALHPLSTNLKNTYETAVQNEEERLQTLCLKMANDIVEMSNDPTGMLGLQAGVILNFSFLSRIPIDPSRIDPASLYHSWIFLTEEAEIDVHLGGELDIIARLASNPLLDGREDLFQNGIELGQDVLSLFEEEYILEGLPSPLPASARLEGVDTLQMALAGYYRTIQRHVVLEGSEVPPFDEMRIILKAVMEHVEGEQIGILQEAVSEAATNIPVVYTTEEVERATESLIDELWQPFHDEFDIQTQIEILLVGYAGALVDIILTRKGGEEAFREWVTYLRRDVERIDSSFAGFFLHSVTTTAAERLQEGEPDTQMGGEPLFLRTNKILRWVLKRDAPLERMVQAEAVSDVSGSESIRDFTLACLNILMSDAQGIIAPDVAERFISELENLQEVYPDEYNIVVSLIQSEYVDLMNDIQSRYGQVPPGLAVIREEYVST